MKVLALYLFAGCGMGQANRQPFDVTDLLTTFPKYFSIQAALHVMDLHDAFRCRVVCCITYDQQIVFIVKGVMGIELMRGIIDNKGVTVVDQSRRLVHQWDYQDIAQQYHFPCNYLFIQSLLLGMAYDPIEHKPSDAFSAHLTYTYDALKDKILSVQLIDTKQRSFLKLIYRYKMATGRTCLSGMRMHGSLINKGKSYQSRITLDKLAFKKLKRPNIRLKIPSYYRKQRIHSAI